MSSSGKPQRYQTLEDPTSSGSFERKKGISFKEQATKSEKVLFVLLVIALLVILGLAIYIGVKKEKARSSSSPTSCTSQACVSLAGEILGKINMTVNPCEEFYDYACGNWIANTIRPDYISRLSTFSSLETINHERLRVELTHTPKSSDMAVGKASQFYATCMNIQVVESTGIEPAQQLVTALGGWKATSSQLNLTAAMIHSVKMYATTPFFSLQVSRDQKDTSRNLYHISQGGTGIPASYYTTQKNDSIRYQTAYRELLNSTLYQFGANVSGCVDGIYYIEHALANASASIAYLRNPDHTYHKLTVDDLQRNYSQIEWVPLLRGILPSNVNSSRVTSDTEVIVQNLEFMQALSELLQTHLSSDEGKAKLANYIIWHALLPTLGDLHTPFQAIANKFKFDTTATQPAPRSKFCVSKTDAGMGDATGRLFVDKYFSSQARDEAALLVKEIKNAFKTNLQDVSWMDDTVRARAAGKVDAVQDLIGYPKFLKNDMQLNDKYAALNISTTCHFCNVMSAKVLKAQVHLGQLFKTPIHEFAMTPATVNAYYEPPENIIVFPAGILQSPFYQQKGPKALSYGGIGAVVGHELTHGFDDKGRRYDKNGNLVEWWDDAANAAFKVRANCLAEQYSKYELYGEKVNGNQTLGENIADHGGIKMSFNAYKKWREANGDDVLPNVPLTSDQLFFIAFAQVWCEKSTEESIKQHLETDVHSPHRFRVVGTLSDFDAFSKAFDCPLGSPMNRKEKCKIW